METLVLVTNDQFFSTFDIWLLWDEYNKYISGVQLPDKRPKVIFKVFMLHSQLLQLPSSGE